jgi:hypothetical protein
VSVSPSGAAMSAFSRDNPSPRYRELLGYYREMHEKGSEGSGLDAHDTFSGTTLNYHVDDLHAIITILGSKTILDYGAGKGSLYKATSIQLPDGRAYAGITGYWGVHSITCYDPGYAPFSQLPRGRFDGVISTDVLEHIPAEDLPWILDEIFGYADEFVFLNIACYEAKKVLPNGENAHCTVMAPEWWMEQIDRRVKQRPGLRYYVTFGIKKYDENGEPFAEPLKYYGKWK